MEMEKRFSRDDYRVAIICPLEVEMTAVRCMLAEEHHALPDLFGDDNRYIFGSLSGLNVVIGALPEGSQGIGAAAAVAMSMKRTFPNIQLRLLVGIGGGIWSSKNDVRLGDVVISMPDSTHGGVVQYNLGKSTTGGFERKGHLAAPPLVWRNLVTTMKSDHRREKTNRISDYIDEMVRRWPRLTEYQNPGPEQDQLFQSDSIHTAGESTCKRCDQKALVARDSRSSTVPVIHYGTIASGDWVVKDAIVRDRIGVDANGALCVEMEAAGLMENFPCIVIRGICDYADAHKNDAWQPYAAATAAGCAQELLTYVPRDNDHVSVNRYRLIPKQRLKHFVGRQDELRNIDTFFRTNNVRLPRILIIRALGGQGKSQLALEYCHRRADIYHGVFWVSSSTEQAIRRSLIEVAHRIIVPKRLVGGSDVVLVNLALETLSRSKDKWLLIFDNCDDPKLFDVLRDYIPSGGNIDIIFTSRHQGLERLGTMMELSSMPGDHALEILLRSCEPSARYALADAGLIIVERLGGLALALDQAAAYLECQNITVRQLQDFLILYERQSRSVLNHVPEELWEYGVMRGDQLARDHAISAFTTWEISLQHLYADNASYQKAAIHLLTLSAFLAPIPISEQVFSAHWTSAHQDPDWARYLCCEEQQEEFDLTTTTLGAHDLRPTRDHGSDRPRPSWSRLRFQQFLRQIRKLSLVQAISFGQGSTSATFSLHPLIRDWLQARISRSKRLQFACEDIYIAADSVPIFGKASIEYHEKRALMLHMDTLLTHTTELLETHPHTGGSGLNEDEISNLRWRLYRFAQFYELMNRYDISHKLFKQGLDASLRQYGADHSYTTVYRIAVASNLVSLGQYEDAEKLCRSVLEDQSTHSSLDKSLVVKVTRLIAISCRVRGNLCEEEEAWREALRTARRLLGSQHQLAVELSSMLVLNLLEQGRIAEATTLYQENMNFEAESLDHIDTTNILVNLGDCLADASTLIAMPKAEVMRGPTGTGNEPVTDLPGPEQDAGAQSIYTRASMLATNDLFEEAENLLHMAIHTRVRFFGVEDRIVLSWQDMLALVLSEQAEFGKAEALLRDMVKVREKLAAEEVSKFINVVDLATAVLKQCRYDESWQIYQQVSQTTEFARCCEQSMLLDSLSSFALALKQHEQYQKAISVYQALIAEGTKAQGPMGPEVIDAVRDLATLYTEQGEHQLSETLLNDIFQAIPNDLGGKHLQVIEILPLWADMPSMMGDYDLSETRYRHAKDLTEQAVGLHDERALDIASGLAEILIHNGKQHEAEQVILGLYRTVRDLLKTQDGEMVPVLAKIVSLLNACDRSEQAHELEHWTACSCKTCASFNITDVD